MGNLDQNPSAIAGLRIAAASPAMRQIDQNLDAFQNDVVRLPPLNAGDKSDAAGVVLMLRAVKSLSRWQAPKWVQFTHQSQNKRSSRATAGRRNPRDQPGQPDSCAIPGTPMPPRSNHWIRARKYRFRTLTFERHSVERHIIHFDAVPKPACRKGPILPFSRLGCP